MHESYMDIRDRLGEPLWWYRHDAAIPRYAEFNPELCGVYDDIAALTTIACQACGKHFSVSVSFCKTHQFIRESRPGEVKFPSQSDAGWFDAWGDPPIHGCSGDTMMSDLVRIDQFWMKERDRGPSWLEWVRRPEFEFNYRAAEEIP